MFATTSNPYKFKYLITGISGPGLEQVYLPPVPHQEDILFKKEQKFVRPEMPDYLQRAVREMLVHRAEKTSKGTLKDPNWVHPKYQQEINDWEDREHQRCSKGIWFWNNGAPTYMTPFHYWYCSAFLAYFGAPDYRETDKELCYFILYCEEDPECLGTTFNTIRRYGKSVLMGAWSLFRTTRNYHHFAGMQGENDKKIKKFYEKFVKKPFFKLPYYHQPTYNTGSQQTESIEFDLPARRYRQGMEIQASLESVLEYRESSEGAYDGDILNTYLMEEPGKMTRVSLYNDEGDGRWDIIVPCLLDGLSVIGKSFLGTTVENLNISEKGGQAYKRLFYDSDFDRKQEDNRTKSGLYACFLPGDCALKGFWDEWGRPSREEARTALLRRRKSFKNNAAKLSGLIRKYPLTVREIFFVNPTSCEFNAKILQARKEYIDENPGNMYDRFVMKWENNIRFSKVVVKHDPDNGWLKASWLPKDPALECNKVDRKILGGVERFAPLNDTKFSCGLDPIDHGIVVDNRDVNISEDADNIGKKSKPVLFVKSKYDSSIDGYLDQEEFERRAMPGKMVNNIWTLNDDGKPFSYQTNRYFVMMDARPYDPNVLYERVLMICWYFGISLHVENQKPGVIRYFHEWNCGDFILNKYQPVDVGKAKMDEGTAASQGIIQEYTGALSAYVEYFGHTIPFIELIEDLLLFKPRKTTEHDYSVAAGFTELAGKIKPKKVTKPLLDLASIMPTFDSWGNRTN